MKIYKYYEQYKLFRKDISFGDFEKKLFYDICNDYIIYSKNNKELEVIDDIYSYIDYNFRKYYKSRLRLYKLNLLL